MSSISLRLLQVQAADYEELIVHLLLQSYGVGDFFRPRPFEAWTALKQPTKQFTRRVRRPSDQHPSITPS